MGRGRLPPGRPGRRAGVRRRLPGARRSSGRSTTSAAGARSTTSSSSRRTARWPRSTTRPPARRRWRRRRAPRRARRRAPQHRRRRRRAPRARRRHAVAERHRPAAARGGLRRRRSSDGLGGVLGRDHRARGARRAAPHGRRSRLIVALINVVTGTLIAWVLVRDDFRGKALVNAIIDLPFALPTIVASIVLLSLYGPRSPIGLRPLRHPPGAGHRAAVRDAAVRRALRAAGADGGRPRGRGGRRVARREQLDDLPPRSSCPRCTRRCSAAPGSRSPARSASSAPSC